ncbi:MAG: GntR family transcriptional regulator [Tissierellaceae bacterium]
MKFLIEEKNSGVTVGDYVYDVIRKNIINLNMIPGQQISENEVADLLGVSRTPVREAFIKLAKEGLLHIMPQRGTYISYIDLGIVEDTRFIRESLEKSVIKLATQSFPKQLIYILQENINAQKRLMEQKLYFEFLMKDEEFHKTIFIGCNKERTWTFIEQINSEYNRVRMLTFLSDINWGDIIKQHQEILDSIISKDEVRGLEIVGNHVQKLIFEQVELKGKFPQYFKN